MDAFSPGQYVTLSSLPPGQYVIYALIDPTEEQVYYVGQTRNPQVRLAAHLSDRHQVGKKGDWLRRLEQKGEQPLMKVLEVVTGQQTALEKEQEWIRHFLAQKMPLFNVEGQPERRLVQRPFISRSAAKVDRVPEENLFEKIFGAFLQKNSASPPKAYPGRRRWYRGTLSALAKIIEEFQALEGECKEMEAQYEEIRRKFCTRQQELYDQPLAWDPDAKMLTIPGVEASWAEITSPKTTMHSIRLAMWVRAIHGTPTTAILAALAARFQVEDILCLSESDWPAILEWFADLLLDEQRDALEFGAARVVARR